MFITPIQISEVSTDNNIYIKHDELIPFSFGGNKVRIAYEYLSDLKRKKCDCLIGYGNSRSNLCRVLANLCRRSNIACYIISPVDDDGKAVKTSNGVISETCGAHIIRCDKASVAQTVAQVMNKCKSDGLNAYYINGDIYGKGNEAVPVEAYVKTYKEILNQERELNINFDYIFLATGTGMTQSGLIAGKHLFGGETEIVGISIARSSEQEKMVIERYLRAYYEKNSIPFAENKINVTDKYVCGGYGKYNDEILKTIKNFMLKNGIALDTTYTGKAFWGMMEYLKENNIQSKNVLFIHTGGTPLFFDDIEKIMKFEV